MRKVRVAQPISTVLDPLLSSGRRPGRTGPVAGRAIDLPPLAFDLPLNSSGTSQLSTEGTFGNNSIVSTFAYDSSGHTSNKAQYTEDLSNATYWYKYRTTISTNLVSNPINLLVDADGIVPSVDNSAHYFAQTKGGNFPGEVLLVSIYAKQNSKSWFRIANGLNITAWFDVANGVVGGGAFTAANGEFIDHGIEDAGNGWYRCWVKFKNINLSGNLQWIFLAGPSEGVTSYIGDTITPDLYIWGLQVEYSDFGVYGPSAYLKGPANTEVGAWLSNDDIGEDLVEFNSGAGVVHKNSPFYDGSVSVAFTGGDYEKTLATTQSIDGESKDLILEVVIHTGYDVTDTQMICGTWSPSSLNGWALSIEAGSIHLFSQGASSTSTAGAAVNSNTWYYVTAYLDRDESSADGCKVYCNAVGGTGTDASGIGTVSSTEFAIGATPNGDTRFLGGIAWCVGWIGGNLLPGGSSNDTVVREFSEKRFAKLTGIYPAVTLSSLPIESMTRPSSAYLTKYSEYENFISLHLVGYNWPRICSWGDAWGSVSGNQNKGLLIEESSENQIEYSEELSSWSIHTRVLAIDGYSDPLFQFNASGIQPDTSSGTSHFTTYDSANLGSNTIIFSAWAKHVSGGGGWIKLEEQGTGNGVYFDIEDGVLGTVDSGIDGYGIEDWGHGWYRCWLAWDHDGVAANEFTMYLAESDGTTTLAGTPTSQIWCYIWGVQGEVAENLIYPSSYIMTSGSVNSRGQELINYALSSRDFPKKGVITVEANTMMAPGLITSLEGTIVSLWDGATAANEVALQVSSSPIGLPTASITTSIGNSGFVSNSFSSLLTDGAAHQVSLQLATNSLLQITDDITGIENNLINLPAPGTITKLSMGKYGPTSTRGGKFLTSGVKIYRTGSRRAEIELPVAPGLGFLASDMDGNSTFNTTWTSEYTFPNGSGRLWTTVPESTRTSVPNMNVLRGSNSANCKFRPETSTTPPFIDFSDPGNGVLTSAGGLAGALDWMIDATDIEIIYVARPLASNTIGGLMSLVNNRYVIAHDLRPASPNRCYAYSNIGQASTILSAAETFPLMKGIMVGSYRWIAGDRTYLTNEAGVEFAGGTVASASSVAGEVQFIALGSAFIGYYDGGIHAALLYDRSLTTQERLDTFAELRARFEDY